MTWYIEENGQTREVTEGVLIYRIQKQEISPNTLVVNEKLKYWVPLHKTELYRQYKPDNDGKTAYGQYNSSEEQDQGTPGLNERRVAVFAWKNDDYYVRKWRAMQVTGSTISWNWGAFFFTGWWMLYRKMYAAGIIMLIANYAASSIFGILGSLAFEVLCGLFGNHLYFEQMKRVYTEAYTMHSLSRDNYIDKKSGTTMVPIVVAILLNIVLYALYVFIIAGYIALLLS